jgi:GTPase involved in cell partitioning and DNA repair
MVEAEHRAEGSEEGGTGGAGGIVVTAAINISKTADL